RDGKVALEFVEWNLNDTSDILAKEDERIGEDPAVLHVRERNQVFGAKLGGDSEFAIRGESEMKNSSDIMQRLSIDHPACSGVNDRDLRLWRSAVHAELGIDVRAVQATTVAGKSQITGAPPGREPLGFFSTAQINHRDGIAQPIGDIERFALPVGNGADGLKSGR